MIGIRTKHAGAALAIGLVVAAVLAAALTQQDSSAADVPATWSAGTDQRTLPAVAAAEVEALGPAGVRLEDSVLAAATDARSLYVTPAAGAVCLSLVGADGATVDCMPRAQVEANAVRPSSTFTGCRLLDETAAMASPGTAGAAPIRCEAVTLYGPVSDGVRDVAVEVAHGEAPAVALGAGAYAVSVPLDQAPAAIRLTGDGVSTRLPADVSGFDG